MDFIQNSSVPSPASVEDYWRTNGSFLRCGPLSEGLESSVGHVRWRSESKRTEGKHRGRATSVYILKTSQTSKVNEWKNPLFGHHKRQEHLEHRGASRRNWTGHGVSRTDPPLRQSGAGNTTPRLQQKAFVGQRPSPDLRCCHQSALRPVW